MSKEEKLDKDVAGEYNTFKVYIYLLRRRTARTREVQRDLGFSSPRLASHHLEKLVGLGLARKEGFYYHVLPRKFGVLRLFFSLGKWVLPKTFFIIFMFLTLTLYSFILLFQHEYHPIALIISISGLAISVYLTMQFYRLLPKT